MLTFLLNLLSGAAGILAEASIYLLFGFFVAGLIHAYFPEDKILKYFGGRNLRSVFNASLLGVPLPLCSCSVIPTAVQLRKSGASRGATISFLISTPETSVDSIGISFSLLDPLLSIYRPMAALVSALAAGLATNFLEKHTPPESPSTELKDTSAPDDQDGACAPAAADFQSRLKRGVSYAFGDLLDDLAPWLILGFLIAAFIALVIPDDFFAGALRGGFLPMLIMLLVGIPLYICATGSTPIAAALILKGLSPGAALVFLLTGAATNIGSLILLSRYLEKRFLVLYIATIAVMSLLLGALLNFIYGALNLDVRATLGSGSEFIPGWLKTIAAIGTAILLHRSLQRGGSYRKIWSGLRDRVGWSPRRILIWVGILLSLIYLSDSLTAIPAGHTGMILSFGKVVQTNLQPGLHLRAPRPFACTVLYPSERIEVVQIGFRLVSTASAASRKNGGGEKFDAVSRENMPEESELLAGDENLIDLDVSVFYCVSDARQALYQIADLEKLLQELSSAELTRQIASRPVWDGLIGGKEDFVESLKAGLQKTLDQMAISVKILHVNLIYAHAPDLVHSAFREVASSLEDKYRLINLAQTDSVAALANARAQFAAALASARSDSARALADASGRSERLIALAKSTVSHRRLQQFRMNAEAAESTLVGREKILLLGKDAAILDLILIPKSSNPAQELPPEVLERLQSSLSGP